MHGAKRRVPTMVVGFVPWVAFAVLASQGWRLSGFAAGLLLAGLLLAWELSRGRVKATEVAATAYFGVQVLLAGIGWRGLERYDLALLYGALAAMAWTTLAIGNPFTLQYAREDWPPVFWDDPAFRALNTALSVLWAAIFTANTALIAGAVQRPTLPVWLFAVVLPNGAVVLGALLSLVLPRVYPRWRLARQLAEQRGADWPVPAFPAQRPPDPARHDAIVVGAGIGGLSAAALLAQRGLKVLVLEHHYLAGGFCTSWPRYVGRGTERQTYVFDAGVHDVSGLGPNGPVRLLLRQLGIEDRVDWRPVSHEYLVGDLRLKVPHSAEAFVQLLGALFPAEQAGVAALFAEMEAIYRELYQDVAKAGGVPLRPRTVDEALAYPLPHPHAYRGMHTPFEAMLDRHLRDPELKRVLSMLTAYLTDEPQRLTATAMAPIFGYYFDGGFYPAGGSQAFADALVGAIEGAGGEVRLRTPVTRILVEEGRAVGVESGEGRIDRAPAVISNADVRRTFLELVGREHLPPAFVRQVQELQPSASALSVYLGVDYVPDIAPLTLVSTPRGTVGIAVPSKTDASLAPPGHSAISLLALEPADTLGEWDRKAPGYRERKRQAGDALVALAEEALPGLRSHIVYRQDATPATVIRFAHTTAGSIYGPAIGWRPAARSPIAGLVLAGSGVFPGAGVEAVVISGVLAADALCPATLRPAGIAAQATPAAAMGPTPTPAVASAARAATA